MSSSEEDSFSSDDDLSTTGSESSSYSDDGSSDYSSHSYSRSPSASSSRSASRSPSPAPARTNPQNEIDPVLAEAPVSAQGDQSGLPAESDSRRIWERPWPYTDLRSAVKSEDWTLASDSGLFNKLKDLSTSFNQRALSVHMQMDSLVLEARATEVKLLNSFNGFLNLAYYQFVENKVFDDDSATFKSEAPETPAAEPTPEEVDAVIRPKFTQAIRLGLDALGMSDVKDEDVDAMEAAAAALAQEQAEISEARAAAAAGAPLANSRVANYWSKRRLPFIIGSAEFDGDEFAGLYVPHQEEEPEDISYEEGLPAVPDSAPLNPSANLAPAPSGDIPAPPPPPSSNLMFAPQSLSEDEGGLFAQSEPEDDLFGGKSDDDLSDELPKSKKRASKGKSKASRRSDKKPKSKPKKSKDEDDLSEEASAPSKQKKAPADENDDDLFGESKPKSKKGDKLFGAGDSDDGDLFGGDDDDDLFGDNKKSKKSSGGLFGDDDEDEEEDDDLFASKKSEKSKAAKEASDDDDIFTQSAVRFSN